MTKLMFAVSVAFILILSISTAPASPKCHQHNGQTHCH